MRLHVTSPLLIRGHIPAHRAKADTDFKEKSVEFIQSKKHLGLYLREHKLLGAAVRKKRVVNLQNDIHLKK